MPIIRIANKSLNYDDRGSGKTIVLLHGFPLDSRIWNDVANRLARRFRVITLDLPGFGKSTNEQAFTLQSLANDIHVFLQKIDAVPCYLAGLSMGGYVALTYAKAHGKALSGLILVNTKTAGDTDDGKSKRNEMAKLALTQGAKVISDQMLPNMTSKQHQTNAQVVGKLRVIMESQSSQTIANACIAMRDRDDFTAQVNGFNLPVLIVAGEQDAIVPLDVSKKMSETINGSELVIIPDAGHMAPIENPQEVASAIAAFVWRD